jgi:hypothetical protein
MSALIDRYWEQYGSKKKSQDREKSVLNGVRDEMGSRFVREVDGVVVNRWYQGLTAAKGLSAGTAVRHFNVMHHMMEKASGIWSKETGIDRNPADAVEVYRPDDQRDRYLEVEEIRRLKSALDSKMYRQAWEGNQRDVFPVEADRSDCPDHGNANRGGFRPEVERRVVQRRADRGSRKAEGRQDAVCTDGVGTG